PPPPQAPLFPYTTLFRSHLIEAQGGNRGVVENPALLPKAQFEIPVKATTSGFITKMEADQIGIAAMLLGAGRATKEDEIDMAVRSEEHTSELQSRSDLVC